MAARVLSGLGGALVLLGLAATLLGWDALLAWPRRVLAAILEAPGSWGLVALGLLLMLAARLVRRS